MKVTARVPSLDVETTVEFDFGKDLAESTELFTDEVVYGKFVSESVVDLQAYLRRLISTKIEGVLTATGISEEDIQEKINSWKPGVSTRTRMSKIDKAANVVAKMSDEEKKNFLLQIQAELEERE